MKIITYFGFTLLSIFIQFCVMDFIQEKLLEDKTSDVNVTTPIGNEDLNNISLKNSNEVKKRHVNLTSINNITSNILRLKQTELSTEITSTILDIFYDENTSTTDFSFTTELISSTDIDNVTGIKYPIDVKPTTRTNLKPKSARKDCPCNLMHEICDINCCCDSDCTDEDEHLFGCHGINEKTSTLNDGVCHSYLFNHDLRYRNNIFDKMFCIVKVNLPEKRSFIPKFDESMPHQHLKWRNHKSRSEQKFAKNLYEIGNSIWHLNNGTFKYLDVPFPLTNDYCYKRKHISFLKNEEIKCTVKFSDLEMFHIFKFGEQTKVISATNITANSSSLNCSSLYCANLTVFVCDQISCEHYNKSVHKPTCAANICTNVATTLDYVFYTRDTTIMNVTVKLFVEKVSIDLPNVLQKIKIKFLLTNRSIENIVEFSGSPGYQKGLRVIFSRAPNNYTKDFMNSRIPNFFDLPRIEHGECIFPSVTSNFITFGRNKRIKCRYVHKNFPIRDNKEICKDMHANIQKILFLNKTMAVSPYGNPQHLSDDEWIAFKFNSSHQEPLYSLVDTKNLKIFCYNIVTKLSLSFVFRRVDEKQNKILSVKHQVMIGNKSFTIKDMSTVITIDISFIDVTKPAVFEYARRPHLDINLPRDFFFPSNRAHFQGGDVYYVLLVYCCIFFFK